MGRQPIDAEVFEYTYTIKDDHTMFIDMWSAKMMVSVI